MKLTSTSEIAPNWYRFWYSFEKDGEERYFSVDVSSYLRDIDKEEASRIAFDNAQKRVHKEKGL